MVDNQKFYKYLNLGTDASSKEIKESYQKLTRIIHPDKQVSGTSDQNKQLSEQIFIKITYAKEILLNPATKYIYDNFGEQGINRISGKKHLLNYEIKTESDKISLYKKVQYLLLKTNGTGYRNDINPRSSVSVSLSISDYLSDEFDKSPWQRKVLISSFQLQELVKLNITPKFAGDLGFILYSSREGCVSMIIPRLGYRFESGYIANLALNIGDQKSYSVSCSKNIGGVGVGVQGTYSNNAFVPSISLSKSLTEATSCHFDASFSKNSSCGVSINSDYSDKTKVIFRTHISAKDLDFTIGFRYKLIEIISIKALQHIKLNNYKVSTKAEIYPEIGISVQLSKEISTSYLIEAGPRELKFVIKLKKNDFSLSLPVSITRVISYRNIGLCFLFAAGLSYIGYKGYNVLCPKDRRLSKGTSEQFSKEERKQDNSDYLIAIKEISRLIRQEESNKNGLIIIKGLYGYGDMKSISNQDLIDVTDALQVLVTDSKLYLNNESKSKVNGFYKPCNSHPLALYIKYKFSGVVIETIVQDTEPLILP